MSILDALHPTVPRIDPRSGNLTIHSTEDEDMSIREDVLKTLQDGGGRMERAELEKIMDLEGRQFSNALTQLKALGKIERDGADVVLTAARSAGTDAAPAPAKRGRKPGKAPGKASKAPTMKPQRRTAPEGRNAREVRDFMPCGPATQVRVIDTAAGGLIALDGGILVADLQPHQIGVLTHHLEQRA